MLKTAAGAVLWDAAVPMTDAADGLPYASIGIPGRDMGLKLLLDRAADGTGTVLVVPYKVVGTATDGQPIIEPYPAVDLQRGDVKVSQGLDLSIGLTDFGEFTLLIAKRDPGQGIVWVAFAALIAGITITFYRPRRRVWTRLASGRPARHRLALRPLRRRGARVRAPARPTGGCPARLTAAAAGARRRVPLGACA